MRSLLALVALVVVGCGDDAPASHDARPIDARPIADGFDVPLETWSWIDVPGMTCGDGSPTGIAINPTTRSQQLVLVFEGGGACWEAAACYGILIPVTASHLDGFDATTFASVRPQFFDNVWAFQRDDPQSLFADATWVFVPYCTGDLHAGTRTHDYMALGQTRTMHHVGATNVDAMLARVAPLPASEVFAIGVSAGGYGVQLNWDRIAAAFPSATTHAFADGAQTVPIEAGRWGTIGTTWAPRFPAGCTDCAASLFEVGAFWRTAPPATGGRYALTNSLQDGTLAVFFGYDAAGMRAQSLAVGTAMTRRTAGTEQAAFMIDDSSHTMFATPNRTTSTSDVLRPWIEAWARGPASAFTTVGP